MVIVTSVMYLEPPPNHPKAKEDAPSIMRELRRRYVNHLEELLRGGMKEKPNPKLEHLLVKGNVPFRSIFYCLTSARKPHLDRYRDVVQIL